MREPQRPWNDDFVDFMVDINGEGLQASAPVTSLQGDGLAEFFAYFAGAAAFAFAAAVHDSGWMWPYGAFWVAMACWRVRAASRAGSR